MTSTAQIASINKGAARSSNIPSFSTSFSGTRVVAPQTSRHAMSVRRAVSVTAKGGAKQVQAREWC
jgi:hypothetical protein